MSRETSWIRRLGSVVASEAPLIVLMIVLMVVFLIVLYGPSYFS